MVQKNLSLKKSASESGDIQVPHIGGYKDTSFDRQVNIKLIAKNSYLFLIFGLEKRWTLPSCGLEYPSSE